MKIQTYNFKDNGNVSQILKKKKKVLHNGKALKQP